LDLDLLRVLAVVHAPDEPQRARLIEHEDVRGGDGPVEMRDGLGVAVI